MKTLLAILLTLPLAAQQADPKPEEAKPAGEKNVSGSVEFGYRWVSEVRGSREAYRSLVDLEKGPRVFGADFTLLDPSSRLFDRIDLTSAGWGGEPHSSLHAGARKLGVYRLTADYSNLAYYNFLPSFANPGLAGGSLLNQRAFDTNRRYTNVDLDLMPGRRIIPYLGYTHDSGSGTGVTPFVADGNEYPVWNRLRDKTDHYRGGVRVEMNRFHVTLEQGATKFKDDQFVGTADRNLGNRTTTLFDQRLVLNSLRQAYGVRGDSVYSKVLLTAAPASWLDVFGQFLYSKPSSDVTYSAEARGMLAQLSAARFFSGQFDTLFAEAKQPHSSGSAGFELRPVKKVRIVESLMTDRFHNASSAVLAEQLYFGTATTAGQTIGLNSFDRLVYNYNRQELDVIVDLCSRLTLRGGHRYEWGNALVRTGALDLRGSEAGELKRQVGLAGFSMRPVQRLSLTLDYERGAGDRSYFRTSLYDYTKLRARARYQLMPSLFVGANFSVLDNTNPTAGVKYDFSSRSNTLSLQWLPQGGKRLGFLGEYSRSTLSSDLNYLDPLYRSQERSFYRDNAHVASALVDVSLPAVAGSQGKMSVGGSLFISHGSRATNYYSPVWRIQQPLVRKVQWFGEWRWYGYSEPVYLYEGFRSHLFQTGLRLSL
ncbi:MAG: hypothetical protein HY822_01850 [Acidobacteria bacterium]|nr:hypothetical protein [Acidobacteriota bacterium]